MKKFESTVSVRLTPELSQQILQIADREQRTRGNVVRMAIAEFLEKRNAKTSEVA